MDSYKTEGKKWRMIYYAGGRSVNANIYKMGVSDLEGIKEALTDPNIYKIGVCGKDGDHMGHQLDTVIRRVKRDDLFGVIVMVSIGKEPNLRSIQEEIAHELRRFSFQEQGNSTALCFTRSRNEEAVTKNARQLSDRIRTEPKILFILRDLRTRLDLAKLGIPFGADHQGCKLILTSESEEVLSDQMNAQRTFRLV